MCIYMTMFMKIQKYKKWPLLMLFIAISSFFKLKALNCCSVSFRAHPGTMAALTPKMLRPYRSCGLQNAHTWKHMDGLQWLTCVQKKISSIQIYSNGFQWIQMVLLKIQTDVYPCAF